MKVLQVLLLCSTMQFSLGFSRGSPNSHSNVLEEKRLLGINPRITISSDTKIIKSPLLMWSESNAFVRFRYTMTKPSKVFAVKSILCYPTLGGRLRRALWSTIVYIKARKQGQLCLRMINPNRNLCKTYKALLTLRPVKGGVLGFDRLDFGGPELCTLQKKKPTTFKCDFEKDGCGIRTDFCSLYDWTIQNRGSSFSKGSDREKRSFGSRKGSSGLALMKRNITGDSCSYPICIPCFQQSGIDVTVIKHPGLFYFGTRNSRERRDLRGVSLFLDPSRRPREGVGPAIADLPEVQYDPDNAYLSFFHEMVPGGKHVLLVRAVCTGRVANDLIPLGPFRLPYQITNFFRVGVSGFVCMSIHRYIDEDFCSSFTIQLIAYAVDTLLSVDDFSFSPSLHRRCSRAHNIG